MLLTEWAITKAKVGNEMEIFITLIKYNTCQQYEESKSLDTLGMSLFCLMFIPTLISLQY